MQWHRKHSKTLIIDSREAFIMSSPFEQAYWDSVNHILHDSRRRNPADGGSGGSGSGGSGSGGLGPGTPIHDISVFMSQCPAVAEVERNFFELWNWSSNTFYHCQNMLDSSSIPIFTTGY